VNGEQRSAVSVVTNAYGTFSGTFTAPVSGLTATCNWWINQHRSIDFSVEDTSVQNSKWLRPVKGTFRLRIR